MKRSIILISLLVLSTILAKADIIEKTYVFGPPSITQSGDYQLVAFDECVLSGLPGEPVLPYHAVKLLLPPGHEAIAIEFTGEQEVFLPGTYHLYPKQYARPYSMGPSGDFIKHEDVYARQDPYPSSHTGRLSTGHMNGYAIALSAFTPLVYHPSSGTVSYYQRVTITITTSEQPRSGYAAGMLSSSPVIVEKVTEFVQNAEALLRYPVNKPREETYHYLIITPEQFSGSFDELTAHYLTSGIQSTIITTEFIESTYSGQDLQEKIRSCIIGEYQDHGIEHVLLAGDVEHIPYRGFYCMVQSSSVYESNNIPSDLYYSGLDGTWNDNGNNRWGEIGEDDLLPDVAVSRLPFSNQSELDKMLHKVFWYQQTPVLNELRDPILAGEWLYGNPETWGSDYLELLIGYHDDNGYTTDGIPEDHNFTKLYDETTPWSGSSLIAAINQGTSFVHHVGHASTTYTMKLSNSDITNANFAQLNGTTHNYTLVYTHGCDCGGFDFNDCILEEMVKIDNFAVAVVGNSRYGWFNEGQTEGPSQHLHREFVDALYHDKLNRIGRAHMESRIETAPWVNAPGQWEEGAQRWCFYDCNVLGECAMPVWTDNPVVPEADYTTVVSIGQPSMEATITYQGDPMEGMRCVVMQGNEFYGLGLTDANGMATIEFEQVFTEPGEAQLIVSGYNCLTTTFPIAVIPSQGPYLVYTAMAVNDDTGNGNGIPEFGETIQLTIDITNVGSQTATGVIASISASDPYITITDGEEDYGTIEGGQTISIENGFALAIGPDIPDQHTIEFELSALAEDTWTSDFPVTFYAPHLALGPIAIDDQDSGNGNGILDPGESAILFIATSNTGHCSSPEVTGTILSTDPYLSIDNGVFQITLLEVDQTVQAMYQMTLSQDAPLGCVVNFTCELTSGAYLVNKQYQLATGIITEDFETGDFLSHEWDFAGDAPWEICETNPFEGSYCARSGAIDDQQTSEMKITASVLADDSISFYYKVSSEADYDFLQFYIDNVKKDEWSGEKGWSYASYAVNAGEHTFRWVYSKDWYVSAGQDCAWVDYIVFPPIYNPVAVPESPADIVADVYPNPFSGFLTVEYEPQGSSFITFSFFNTSGQLLMELEEIPSVSQGKVTITQPFDSWEPGVYFCRIRSDRGVVLKKLVKIR